VDHPTHTDLLESVILESVKILRDQRVLVGVANEVDPFGADVAHGCADTVGRDFADRREPGRAL
jgi:hypothetical protein